MFVWNAKDEVFRTNNFYDVPEARCSMDEKITDEIGVGNKQFLCIGVGIHGAPAVAVIHADNVNSAEALRDEFFAQRINNHTIIFENLYEIVV